jgi:hypothetical protein
VRRFLVPVPRNPAQLNAVKVLEAVCFASVSFRRM